MTDAGKTFTMIGNKSNPGVTQRAIEAILQYSGMDSDVFNTTVKMSMYEVYNEKLTDLLGNNLSADLDIRTTKEGGSRVENGSEWPIHRLEDFVGLLDRYSLIHLLTHLLTYTLTDSYSLTHLLTH